MDSFGDSFGVCIGLCFVDAVLPLSAHFPNVFADSAHTLPPYAEHTPHPFTLCPLSPLGYTVHFPGHVTFGSDSGILYVYKKIYRREYQTYTLLGTETHCHLSRTVECGRNDTLTYSSVSCKVWGYRSCGGRGIEPTCPVTVR